MAETILNPNRQGPENYGNLTEAMSAMLRTAALDSEVCLPCRVVSYDREKNTAIIHPLIKVVLTSESVSRSEIGPVPVFALGSQQFVINFPLKPGDLGWMIANDRDITKFLESLGESEPDTYRVHDFNDAVFYPDMIRGYTINEYDSESLVIQSKDGKQCVSIGPNQIFLRHDVGVTIQAPGVTVNGPLQADSLTAKNGITTTAVDGNGKILNFAGGSLVGSM